MPHEILQVQGSTSPVALPAPRFQTTWMDVAKIYAFDGLGRAFLARTSVWPGALQRGLSLYTESSGKLYSCFPL